MDEIIKRLDTPEKCYEYVDRFTNLANQARQRAIELKASSHELLDNVEKELLMALYAYEEILTKKNGRRTRANRTWQMVKKYGIKIAAERAVSRTFDTLGYNSLVEMGLKYLTFESIIVKYPKHFSKEAVMKAKERLSKSEMH